MRLATIIDGGVPTPVVVRDARVLVIAQPLNELAARGLDGLGRVTQWADAQPASSWWPLERVRLGPATPDPGAIYTIGLNYRPAEDPDEGAPDRPMVFGKVPVSVGAHGASVTWDRALTANVDAECELGVVVGPDASVFGYTIVNDMGSRDPWLDGDQWLLGKSMPGFCPVGPWIVTPDELDPADLGLGCTVNGVPIQDGRTSQMRFSISEQLAFLARHVELRPGDLIATGTPARLEGPLGPDRHLQPGDVVTCWIDGLGELTTIIA
jgi:2-keto-4-pentenoate hydratase/2-oxohepta-3-ene-1,7-dioic acid hydratase in catechol pathway